MTLSNTIWYLIIAGCAGGVTRESFVSVRRSAFSSLSAGWMMAYVGTAILALQPLIFPSASAPASARAYVNVGGTILVIGLLIALASRFGRKPTPASDLHSTR